MARRRVIDPEFWFDEEIGILDSDTQLTYIGSWNFADDYGVIEASPKWMKAKIFPYKQVDIEACIKTLVKLNKFIVFEADGKKWIHIKNFLKIQKVQHPSVNRNPNPPHEGSGGLMNPHSEHNISEVKLSEVNISEAKLKEEKYEEKPIVPPTSGPEVKTSTSLRESMFAQAKKIRVHVALIAFFLLALPFPTHAKTTITVRTIIKSPHVKQSHKTTPVSKVPAKALASTPPLTQPRKIALAVKADRGVIESKIREVFGEDSDIAVAIAKSESINFTDFVGDETLAYQLNGIEYGKSYGPFQIRYLPGRPTPDELLNIDFNIEYAHKLFSRSSWGPWSSFKNGGYLRYL